MQIFVQQYAGLPACGSLGEIDQRAHRLVLESLRGHRDLPIALIARYGEHRGNETHIAQRAFIMTNDERFELVELRFRRLIARELQRPFEVIYRRPEGTVNVVRRALKPQRLRAFLFQALA